MEAFYEIHLPIIFYKVNADMSMPLFSTPSGTTIYFAYETGDRRGVMYSTIQQHNILAACNARHIRTHHPQLHDTHPHTQTSICKRIFDAWQMFIFYFFLNRILLCDVFAINLNVRTRALCDVRELWVAACFLFIEKLIEEDGFHVCPLETSFSGVNLCYLLHSNLI